jgi:hypothetical protein
MSVRAILQDFIYCRVSWDKFVSNESDSAGWGVNEVSLNNSNSSLSSETL